MKDDHDIVLESESELQYKDYTDWHYKIINQNLETYWKTIFKNLPERPHLPSKNINESAYQKRESLNSQN